MAEPAGSGALEAPLRALFERLPAGPVGVAVSGGADSAMLAVHAVQAAGGRRSLHLLHIDHGLQAASAEWAARVRALGADLGVPVHVARVHVDASDGKGIEAGARAARYAALNELARAHGAGHVLLAHHLGDQAETVLLRLLRGSGLHGLRAMAAEARRDGIAYLRPWLVVDRARILEAAAVYAARTGWQAVDDPTNADPAYTRAAVRTLLAPVLDQRWPGWRRTVARHARHVAQAVQVLDDVARADFAALEPADDDREFSLAAWRALPEIRQAQALRHWFGRHGVAMPTGARLEALARQLRQLHAMGHDRQMLFHHAEVTVRCVRGRVRLQARAGRQPDPRGI